MQKARRGARELALNILYQINVAALPLKDTLDSAMENSPLGKPAREYALRLAFGVIDHLLEIDHRLRDLSVDWPPKRQSFVDRNILRIAVFEIDHVDSVPDIVAIDEAIELAKKYSSTEAARFIAGVLGAYLREVTAKHNERNSA